MFKIETDWGIPGSEIDDELAKDDREHSFFIGAAVVAVFAIIIGFIYYNGFAGVSSLCYVGAILIVIVNVLRGEGDILIVPGVLAIIGGMIGVPTSAMFAP